MSESASPAWKLDRRQFLSLAAFTAVLAACTGGEEKSGPVQVPSADATFNGTTVRVAVGSFMASGVRLFVDEWQRKTGGKVEVVEIPFGDLYSKLFQAFSSRVDAYDVVIYAGGWVSGFANAKYIASLEPYFKAKDNWDAILPKVQTLSYVGKDRYTVPLDGDVIMLYYRKDAFENPEAMSRFRNEVGRDLRVPQTWTEYLECAKFFTGWDWAGTGQPCYGVLEAMKPKDVGPYIFTAHAASYAAHPDQQGSLFFDPKTMKPQVSNPGWVQALTEWTELKQYGPSQMVTYGGGDQRGNFVAGNYALAIDWPDIGVLAQDVSQSVVKEKLGYAVIPGATRVWNQQSKAWDEFPDGSVAPYLGWGGWHASVTATSPNQGAAWHFANWLDTTPNALTAVTTPGTARGPYRTDHFNVSAWTGGTLQFANAQAYLDAQQKSFAHPNAQFDLRIPEAGRYIDSLDTATQLALSGQKSPQDALTACAEEWTSITDQIGKDSQQKLYRQLQVSD
ncbi:extracellular solute-binding protein [Georgenia sp. SYP-B2076]|uniref:extracellular solute-binding protein n=1 Tax=Georgenia sp. SYP-B2076 TaxID=2495881 RepID=UPI000F8CCCA5|nr:extracellular solute-binding protein [Georgenia sp. SYP-B2076]